MAGPLRAAPVRPDQPVVPVGALTPHPPPPPIPLHTGSEDDRALNPSSSQRPDFQHIRIWQKSGEKVAGWDVDTCNVAQTHVGLQLAAELFTGHNGVQCMCDNKERYEGESPSQLIRTGEIWG